MARQTKSEIILTRVTPDDKSAFEKAAAKEGMTLAEFMRAAALAYMALRLDGHALRAALRGGMELLKEFEEEGRGQFLSKKIKA